jgi:crotonobetainyl-CoA:carnitine CoA-transferase CaiB-like acyl-CoA transferase
MSAIFLGVNRSKKSVVLNLKRPEAQAALHRLLASADVFVHSMRPQKLAKLDLDPASVMARHPQLIFVSLLGFAEDGPYGGRPAYDDIIQGLCGNAALMAAQTGTVRYFPTISADKTSGLVAALSISAAIAGRARQGGRARWSKCRCSNRWWPSIWSSICTGSTSSRRVGRPAIRACWRRCAGRTRPRTATSA